MSPKRYYTYIHMTFTAVCCLSTILFARTSLDVHLASGQYMMKPSMIKKTLTAYSDPRSMFYYNSPNITNPL